MAVIFFFVVIVLSFTQSQLCVLENSLSNALQSHETAYDVVSNCVYLFGGGTQFNTRVSTIYKREISQTNWIRLSASTPTSYFYSYNQNSVIIDRIVYFIGIKDSSSNYKSGKIYKFDTLTENWISSTQLTAPAHPSTYGCLSDNGTHLFMVGGQSASSTNDDYLQIYDINDNLWSAELINISPITGNGWVYQYCYIVDNELYAFGGFVGGIGRINNIFKYNPLNKWLLLSSILPNVASSGATVFKHPYIYLVGGWDGSSALNTIIEFDTDTESISNTYTMREAIHSMGADIINDKVYIFGGATGASNAITNVEQCDILPQVSTTIQPSYEPSNDPSYKPSTDPFKEPSTDPSEEPSSAPSYEPYNDPSHDPSKDPSNDPSSDPSNDPSKDPSSDPSEETTKHPSEEPFNFASSTLPPSYFPSNDPITAAPVTTTISVEFQDLTEGRVNEETRAPNVSNDNSVLETVIYAIILLALIGAICALLRVLYKQKSVEVNGADDDHRNTIDNSDVVSVIPGMVDHDIIDIMQPGKNSFDRIYDKANSMEMKMIQATRVFLQTKIVSEECEEGVNHDNINVNNVKAVEGSDDVTNQLDEERVETTKDITNNTNQGMYDA